MPKFSFFTNRFSKIRFSLLMVVVISTLPIFALTLLNGIQHRQMMAKKALDEAKQSAILAANELHHLIDDSQLHFKTFSQLSEFQNGNSELCSKSLTDLYQQFPVYADLQMLDTAGVTQCRAEQPPNETGRFDPAWLQEGIKTRNFFVQEIPNPEAASGPFLAIGYPVVNATGGLQYYLITTIKDDWLKEFFSTLNLPAGSTITLITGEGEVLAQGPNPDRLYNGIRQHPQPIASMLSGTEGNFQARGEDGQSRLYGFTSLPDLNQHYSFKIGVGIPTDAALLEANQLLLGNLLGVVIVALLAVWVTWFASDRFLFNKISYIIEAMQRFSAGEMTARTRLASSHHEIDYLGFTFDQMADDIDQKRQEGEMLTETLGQSEKKFRTLAETAPAAIFIYKENRFVYVNSASEPITGYSPSELVGMEFLKLVAPEDQAMVKQRAQDRQAGKAVPTRYEFSIITKTGEERRVDFAADVINYEGEMAVLGIAMDITDRYRAEEQLHLLGTAFQSAANAVVITDREGVIQWINPAFSSLTGYPATEALGSQPRDLVKSGFQDQGFYEQLWKTILAGQVWHGYLTNRRKDQSLYIEEQTITPVRDAKGAVRYFVSIKQDITEHRMHEREHEVVADLSTVLRFTSSSKDMPAIILDHVLSDMKASGAALAFIVPGHEDQMVFQATGCVSHWNGCIPAIQHALALYSHEPNDIYISHMPHTDPLFASLDIDPETSILGMIPLMIEQKTHGAIWVAWNRPANMTPTPLFIEEIKHVLNAVASLTANALHRSALHEKSEKQLQQMASLRAIDAAISNNLESRLTLNIVLREVITNLQVTAASIILFNSTTQTLETTSWEGFRDASFARFQINLATITEQEQQFPIVTAFYGKRIVRIDDLQPVHLWQGNKLSNEGFASLMVIPFVSKGQVKGLLELFNRTPFPSDQNWLHFIESIAGQAAIAIDHAELIQNLAETNLELSVAYDANIEGWSRALDLRDQETEGHSQRVTEITLQLARRMGVKDGELVHIRRGALLHDIGKMGVPDAILRKPGKLTAEEWQIMREHPANAYKLLSPIAYMRPALDIPYCHHEKWDGSGYPRGLRELEIPLSARIFAVADVWDALRSDRPYRPAWPREQTIAYILEQSGKHFDPEVVKAFLALLHQNETIS